MCLTGKGMNAMNIICLGDALIDFKEVGTLTFKGFVGGSPLNVAVAAARLGETAGFASQVSSDQFGGVIRAHLRENGGEHRVFVGE